MKDDKEQALEAIETVGNRLAAPDQLTELERVQLSATLEFARRKVGSLSSRRSREKKDTVQQ